MAERPQVEAFEDVEHLEGRHALAVRRQLVETIALVVCADGLNPVGVLCGEVVHRHRPVEAVEVLDDPPSDLTLVEGVTAALGELTIGPSEARVGDYLTVFGGLPVQQILSGEMGVAREAGSLGGPSGGSDLGHGEALLGVLDGWLEDFGEGHRAVLGEQCGPTVHGTGDTDRKRAGHGDLLEAARSEELNIGGGGREAAAVETRKLARLGCVDQGEHVATRSGHHGLDDGECGGGRDGGVNGVPALLQDAQARLRGQRLAGRDHAVAGDDGGASGVGLAGGAVGGEYNSRKGKSREEDLGDEHGFPHGQEFIWFGV